MTPQRPTTAADLPPVRRGLPLFDFADGEVGPLLAAVHDDPDAEAPRRVLADWLDDRGDARGQFVRFGLAFQDRPSLAARRAAQWLRAYRTAWLGPTVLRSGVVFGTDTRLLEVSLGTAPLADAVGRAFSPQLQRALRQGWVTELGLWRDTDKPFAAWASELGPAAARVRFTNCGYSRLIERLPELGAVRRLTLIAEGPTPAECDTLAAAGTLRELIVHNAGLPPWQPDEGTLTGRLGPLQELRLIGFTNSGPSLRVAAMPRLRSLQLRGEMGTGLDLADLPELERLEVRTYDHPCELRAAGCDRLQSVDLLGDARPDTVARIAALPALKSLTLRGGLVGRLDHRDIAGFQWDDRIYNHLLGRLAARELYLRRDAWDQSHVDALAGATVLEDLGLPCNLALQTPTFPHLPNLRRLDLSHCQRLTGLDVSALPRLEVLTLTGCHRLRVRALRQLATLPALREVDVRGCRGLSAASLRRLRASRPDVVVASNLG